MENSKMKSLLIRYNRLAKEMREVYSLIVPEQEGGFMINGLLPCYDCPARAGEVVLKLSTMYFGNPNKIGVAISSEIDQGEDPEYFLEQFKDAVIGIGFDYEIVDTEKMKLEQDIDHNSKVPTGDLELKGDLEEEEVEVQSIPAKTKSKGKESKE